MIIFQGISLIIGVTSNWTWFKMHRRAFVDDRQSAVPFYERPEHLWTLVLAEVPHPHLYRETAVVLSKKVYSTPLTKNIISAAIFEPLPIHQNTLLVNHLTEELSSCFRLPAGKEMELGAQ